MYRGESLFELDPSCQVSRVICCDVVFIVNIFRHASLSIDMSAKFVTFCVVKRG